MACTILYMNANHFPLVLPAKILLLGSGELGKEMAISLQRLGCTVVAAYSYPEAPAMQVAQQSHVLDMTDAAQLRDLLREVKPDLVVPEVEKLAAGVLEEWMEQNRGQDTLAPVRVVPNAPAVQATFDRRYIRTLAAETAGVATSRYGFANSASQLGELANKIGYPCFVKPTMSSSGHGQSLVTAPEQVEGAWKKAQSDARAQSDWVICESKVNFDYEITLLTVRHLDAHGQVQTSFCAPIGHTQSRGDYVESWQPHQMAPKVLAKAREVAKAVVDALAAEAPQWQGPTLGVFGVELFVAGDEVMFSELSPRPHDTGMVTMISQYHSEFDLQARAILGLPLDVSIRRPGASVPIKSQIRTDSPRYEGVEEALATTNGTNACVDVRIFGKPQAYNDRRMGVAMAVGTSTAEAREAAGVAAASVKVR